MADLIPRELLAVRLADAHVARVRALTGGVMLSAGHRTGKTAAARAHAQAVASSTGEPIDLVGPGGRRERFTP